MFILNLMLATLLLQDGTGATKTEGKLCSAGGGGPLVTG